MMLLGKEGLLSGGAQFIGICHDDPAVSPEDKTRYDACVTVDKDFHACGDIVSTTVNQLSTSRSRESIMLPQLTRPHPDS